MNLFRLAVGLLTRDGAPVDPRAVEAAVSRDLPGFRAYEARGFWMGNAEPALIVEALDTDGRGPAFYQGLARRLAHEFRQECVLCETVTLSAFTFEEPEAVPVTAPGAAAEDAGVRA